MLKRMFEFRRKSDSPNGHLPYMITFCNKSMLSVCPFMKLSSNQTKYCVIIYGKIINLMCKEQVVEIVFKGRATSRCATVLSYWIV